MPASIAAAQKVCPRRLDERLARLASFGAREDGGVNRQVFSDADRAARAELICWAEEMDLELYCDPIANQFFRLAPDAAVAGLPPVLTGSHLDSQPTGGRLDGAYGVVAAFEAVQAIREAGVRLQRPIEIVAWSNEEGSRFAPGCMGSMCFSAARGADAFMEVRDAGGLRLADELEKTRQSHPQMQRREFAVPLAAYLELHIEQGPVLEEHDTPIGVVSGIQGCRWFKVTVTGEARHAGTTPMDQRRDALHAAVQYIAALQQALDDPTAQTRFTVGRLDVSPNTPNTVAERVSFSIDLRHPRDAALEAAAARIHDILASPQAGCSADCQPVFLHPAVQFDERLISIIEDCCQSLELRSQSLASGAFHDALFLADHCPSAMIFVPSQSGISHHPAENTPLCDLVAGARVLAAALEATQSQCGL